MKIKTLLFVLLAVLVAGSSNFAKSPTKAELVTIDNLKEALTGETTASAKYMAYSKKAKEEGYSKVALLFEAASKAEKIHANNHKAVLEQLDVKVGKIEPKYEVKSTKENLEDAIKGESYESATMYPEFLKNAQEGNVTLALISFNYAFQTEKKHKAMYENALEKLNNKQESTLSSLYMVCTTCGNTYDGKAPKRCGISMTPRERFITIQ